MKLLGGTGLIAGVLFLGGCAAGSPDVVIFTQKNIHIKTTGVVTVTYTANSEVKSDAELEGTIPTTTTIPVRVR